MNTVDFILTLLVCAAALADMFFVYSRDLMMLQQNSYRNERYLRWYSQAKESTATGRLFCMVAFFLMVLGRVPAVLTYPAVIIILMWQTFSLARKKYKKPLVRTKRVNRIFLVMWLLTAIIAVLPGIFFGLKVSAAVLVGLLWVSPLILLASNVILAPVEKHINRKFYNEAVLRAAMARLPPSIISTGFCRNTSPPR